MGRSVKRHVNQLRSKTDTVGQHQDRVEDECPVPETNIGSPEQPSQKPNIRMPTPELRRSSRQRHPSQRWSEELSI